MKKMIRKILAFTTLTFASLVISCNNIGDKDEEAKAFVSMGKSNSTLTYISVNVENADSASSRTLLPTIEISNLVLKGTHESGEEQVLATADTLTQMSAKQIEIQTGNWSFTLTATVSGKAYSGTLTKDIESTTDESEKTLNFTLEPADGVTTGTLDFSLSFTGNDTEKYTIKVNIASHSPSYEKSSGEKLECFLYAIPEGTHTLTVDFYANDTSEILNTYKSIVRIERGITTKAEVTNFNLNEVYSITYENYEPTVKDDVPVADTLDPTNSVMTLKFSRKSGETEADGEKYITLPKLSNDNMTFSGWYTSSDFAETSKVAEFGTAPDTVQKIKVTDNLADLTLYAKWIYNISNSITNAASYSFSFTASSKFIKAKTEKKITITPIVKRNGTEVSYDGQNQKIDGKSVSWDCALYTDGTTVPNVSLSTEPTAKGLAVSIPALPYEDIYTLNVSAEFCGIKHNTEFILGPMQEVNVTEVIAQINSAATGSVVKVEGILDEEKFKQIAAAFESKSLGVDLSETEGLAEITEEYFGTGAYKFQYLQSVILPEGVTKIGESAFFLCSNLKKLHIPASVTEIEGNAFNLCSTGTGLDITLDEGSETFDLVGDFIMTKDHKKIVLHAKGTSTGPCVIPNYVEEICDYAFVSSRFYSISFEDNSHLKKIGTFAFHDCKNFSSITIPDSVEEIGDNAFRYCNNLSTVNLPKGNYKIVNEIISFCDKVQEIRLPEGVATIKTYAFSSWAGFRSGTFGYVYLPSTLEKIESNAFNGVTIYAVYYNGTADDRARIESNILDSTIKAITWNYQQ